jgi:hypothetical protein
MGARTAVCIWVALILTGIARFETSFAAPATPALIAEVLAALDKGDAQTAAFLAGEPLTLGWVSQSPAPAGSERAYVYCWITIDND